MRITVIGTGYLGAVHAACMAEIGHEVLGVDTDTQKIAALREGRAPFFEPGLEEILVRAVGSGKLRFSTSLQEAAEFGDAHFICVGTPQLPGGTGADLSHIEAVVDGLAPYLTRDCLVIGKSTVPVGTAARLAARIAGLAPAGVGGGPGLEPGIPPRGLRGPGHSAPGPDRGGRHGRGRRPHAARGVRPVLELGTPYITTDLATAELVKVAANAFLATKISFINAVANVCDAAGADVMTLADALGHDSRIGRRFLSAGLGFGGGCLSKDIRAFMARADELGVGDSLHFLHEVDQINTGRRALAVEVARELAGGSFAGRNVAVLGAAFKPDTDDVRDSPALEVARTIQGEGAVVRVHDPRATYNARRAWPALDYVAEAAKACEAADVVLHLTEWQRIPRTGPV